MEVNDIYNELYYSDQAPETPGAIAMDPVEINLVVSDIDREQEMILIVLQVGSAILSLIGSSTIVLKIARNLYRQKTTVPYDRIMLGLSTCDIVASCVYASSPFLLPAATSKRPWAFGTSSSCQFLGLVTQLACVWAIWYNCLLSCYFLLTVRFQVKRETFAKKYELWMHLSGAIFFPITAIVGYLGGWYGEQELTLQCWNKDVPTGCDEFGENCTGDADVIVGLVYAGLPGAITLISLLVNNTVIYLHVRKTFSKKTNSSSSSTPDSFDDEKSVSSVSTLNRERQLLQEKFQKEIATQGFFYVFFFLITLTPMAVLLVLDGIVGYDGSDKPELYPLLVLNSLLVPLQGFFNGFIYVRPAYHRFRAKNPTKPMWFILKRALFDPNIPRMKMSSGKRSSERNSSSLSKSTSGYVEAKHSQMKMKGGSNFSMSLDNIAEGEYEGLSDIEEDSVSGSNSVEDFVMTTQSFSNSESEP